MLSYIDYMLTHSRKFESHYTFLYDGKETDAFRLVPASDNRYSGIFKGQHSEIEWDSVAFHPADVSTTQPYLLHPCAISRLKEAALKESVKLGLDSIAEAVSYYYDYYKSEDQMLQVYILANYVTSSNDFPVLVKFDSKGDQLTSIKEHKLKGLVNWTIASDRVTTETVDAWRYIKLDWKVVKELSPTFYDTVLKGAKP